MLIAGVVLLAYLPPWVTAVVCTPRTPPSNACLLGGGLEVSSVPNSLPVDAAHCNVVYNKTDFQHQPEFSYPPAEKVIATVLK